MAYTFACLGVRQIAQSARIRQVFEWRGYFRTILTTDIGRRKQVLVSRVVTDLIAGAGLKFTERGAFDLKGIPSQWDLFAVAQ